MAVESFLDGKLPPVTPKESGGVQIKVAYPNLPDLEDFIAIYPIPRSDEMIVILRNGKLFTFKDDPNASQVELFMDISDRIIKNEFAAAYNTLAFYTIAFHPDYNLANSPNKDFFYVYYMSTEGKRYFANMSRFRREPASNIADINSELIMIRQKSSGDNGHFGAEMFFDKEGFLFISMGDFVQAGTKHEEWKKILYDDTQRIDRVFNSCVLRIDVDRDYSRSHPIPKTLQARKYLQKKIFNGNYSSSF